MNEKQHRDCLKCGHDFVSAGFQNRLCEPCRRENALLAAQILSFSDCTAFFYIHHHERSATHIPNDPN